MSCELRKRLRKSESGHRIENEIYHIEMDAEQVATPPMVGARYHFRLEDVVDCPEYLVHLPFFTKYIFLTNHRLGCIYLRVT